MKNPFAAVFLVSLALLAAAHHLDIAVHQPAQLTALLSFLAALISFRLKTYKPGYLFITLAIALLLTSRFIEQKQIFYQLQQLPLPQNQYISIQGKLTSFPEIKDDYSVIFLESQSLEFNREKILLPVNIRIKVTGNLEHLYRGDSIALHAKVYQPTFSTNFFPNSFESYLLVRKSHFNGYCKSARLVTKVKNAPLLWRLIGGWRNSIRKTIAKNLPPSRGVFLQAVIIGDRGQLSESSEEELLNAGVFHLLAISGAHIGIIAFLCLGILKVLNAAIRNRYMVTAAILILFLALSGFTISAERAVLMALLVFIARVLALDVGIYNLVSFCGLLLLARNPAEFLDAGFILTFALTASIIMGRQIFLPLMEKWEFFQKRPWQIGELLSANVSASLMALPLSLYYFKRYSFTGILAGLLLIPLTGIITGLGLLLIPLAPLSPFLAKLLLFVLDIPLRLFFYITSFVSERLDLTLFRASPSLLIVLIIFTAFFLLSVSKTKPQKAVLSSIVLLLILFISLNLFHYSPKHLEVFFLDVGQGDAQLVVFPGGDALLIDGGGAYFSDFQVGRNILLPFLLQKRIAVKWIAVSHYHPDHAYGIAEIIRIIKPRELWISSETPGEAGYQKLFQALPASTRVVNVTARDGNIKKIRDCTVEFLYPLQFIKADRSHNNHSQVIKISSPNHSFLLAGDIEAEVENRLREKDCSSLRATVIKVPHHGSASSSAPGFLSCVRPRLAIFSYSLNNRFRFPHKKVVEAYRELQVRFLSTARSGGIRLVSQPGEIKIETSR